MEKRGIFESAAVDVALQAVLDKVLHRPYLAKHGIESGMLRRTFMQVYEKTLDDYQEVRAIPIPAKVMPKIRALADILPDFGKKKS